MSRRRPKGELQFGSDSFLDVVANIVGILIILIVIAGLRVSQYPVLKGPSDSAAEAVSLPVASTLPELPAAVVEEKPASPPQVVVVEPAEETPPEEPPPPLPELEAPPELISRADQLQAEIQALLDEEAQMARRTKASAGKHAALVERQRAIQTMLAEQSQELETTRQQVAQASADVELLQQTFTRLQSQLKDAEATSKNIQSLEHPITPISRVVNGAEKHYRLEKNRVVEVPLDELVNRFKEQFQRRKEWIVKTRQQQGEVGPVRGFTMRYTLRFQPFSGVDAARFGYEGYALSVSRWEMRPEAGNLGETAEVALTKGSRFYQSILGTAPDTTLTFWVYPDSYPVYGKLRKFAHDHGFSVAARPLPHGLHIAGSPDGTKSNAE